MIVQGTVIVLRQTTEEQLKVIAKFLEQKSDELAGLQKPVDDPTNESFILCHGLFNLLCDLEVPGHEL